MSIQARQHLVDSKFTVFRSQLQRDDLLNSVITQTGLIALLLELTSQGFYMVFTAIRRDHHNDSSLGLHSHYNGYAADLWPLNTSQADDYMDAKSPHFQDFLEACERSPWVFQIGLAGTADTEINKAAAGETCFSDTGDDHIHLGSQ